MVYIETELSALCCNSIPQNVLRMKMGHFIAFWATGALCGVDSVNWTQNWSTEIRSEICLSDLECKIAGLILGVFSL